MPSVPTMTAEQRSAALAKAARARAARSELRSDLKAGRISIAVLLDRAATEEYIASMRVTAVLDALPGYGKVKAAALLADLKIAQSRRLRGLGPNQRAALLSRIERPAESPT
jgi:hypothetical protein